MVELGISGLGRNVDEMKIRTATLGRARRRDAYRPLNSLSTCARPSRSVGGGNNLNGRGTEGEKG